MQLRSYQETMYNQIYGAWSLGLRNPLAVLPTGAGKTVLFARILADSPDACVAIAHRSELVCQMSLALARYGVTHRILAPLPIIRWIIQMHVAEVGRDFYDPNSRCAVAGVDTLVSWSKPESRHHDSIMRWAAQVKLWVTDEAAHLQANNKWGKATLMFPNARGLGVTATPERADGAGLGRHADGIIDAMLEGPSMRELITMGYLSDYRVLCPPSDIHLEEVKTGSDGDYVRTSLASVTKKSSVMGDVVQTYLRVASGKLGVTFAPNVEIATEMAVSFRRAGVPSEVVSAKTPGALRMEILRQFKKREVLQLVSVDIFAEGFDLPAIEVVSMARATQSYALYCQQFGRALRPMKGKDRALILDHVGNVVRHGLPDSPHVWTLDRREKRSTGPQEGVIPLRVCLNSACMSPFMRSERICPFCGWIPTPTSRSGPEFVDGSLVELDLETLARMRGEVIRVDRSTDEVFNAMQPLHGYVIAKSIANKHAERQKAQRALRDSISLWGGHQRHWKRSDDEGHRRFYFTFGVDVLSAQALGRADAEHLTTRINADIARGVK